jgi:hypothetical protein
MSGQRQLGWPVFCGLRRRERPAVSVASETARRLDGEELVEIEVGDGLQGLGGGAVAGGVRYTPVMPLRPDQLPATPPFWLGW